MTSETIVNSELSEEEEGETQLTQAQLDELEAARKVYGAKFRPRQQARALSSKKRSKLLRTRRRRKKNKS